MPRSRSAPQWRMTQVAFTLRDAQPQDLPAIVGLIRELADFEQLTHLVRVTPETLQPHLFGPRPVAEALVGEVQGQVVAFALFFTNFSTFLGQPGLYLEDLYVQPAHRRSGWAVRCCSGWRPWPCSVAAGASSGACWTGTRTRSTSIGAWAPP
jgi:GNAT superfamily N-acetyltransferase